MNRTIFKAFFLLLVLTFVQAQAQNTGKTSIIKPSELLSLENASHILGMDLQIDEKYFDKPASLGGLRTVYQMKLGQTRPTTGKPPLYTRQNRYCSPKNAKCNGEHFEKFRAIPRSLTSGN